MAQDKSAQLAALQSSASMQQFPDVRTHHSTTSLPTNQFLNMTGTLGSQQNQNLGPTQIFYQASSNT